MSASVEGSIDRTLNKDQGQDCVCPPTTTTNHPDLDPARYPRLSPEAEEIQEYLPRCEFGPTCTSGCIYNRKIISHIFGRNKTCTRLIPQHAWVYFCRKHYQRARFRSAWWANIQCELVKAMLDRLERWGQVVEFELALRKRETDRVREGCLISGSDAGEEGEEGDGDGGEASSSLSLPLSVPASVPCSAVSHILCTLSITTNKTNKTSSTPGSEKRPPASSKCRSRKPPTVRPVPVPKWLHELVGPRKSFQDIRDIVDRLQAEIPAQTRARALEALAHGAEFNCLYVRVDG